MRQLHRRWHHRPYHAVAGVLCDDADAGRGEEFVLSSSGHIQSVINPPGNAKAKYFLNSQLPAGPDAWLAAARQHDGSWWGHWRDWLVARSGQPRPAPILLGNPYYPPQADAPGTYVLSD